MIDYEAIQDALSVLDLDGWLFYDFHQRDNIAEKILCLDKNKIFTRRWYYFIPLKGEPHKLVHSIEPYNLDHLPGEKHKYLSWGSLRDSLKSILTGSKKIAMQYSEKNMIPYICIVDAGTMDLIRSFDINVVSSGELVSIFESHLTDENIQSHINACEIIYAAKDIAFSETGRNIRNNEQFTEFDIQQLMVDFLKTKNMTWDLGPIVSVNEHNADPHFMPTKGNAFPIKKDDTMMIDVWAKENKQGSIYADITWMGFLGDSIPSRLENIFSITCKARNKAVNLINSRFENDDPVFGYEVDDACRSIINETGFGENFFHRTGHNIGEEVHGPGVHMDNLETMDDRRIIKGSCFSIEPGIYLPDEKNGFRTEIDVIITNEGSVKIAGEMQQYILALL